MSLIVKVNACGGQEPLEPLGKLSLSTKLMLAGHLFKFHKMGRTTTICLIRNIILKVTNVCTNVCPRNYCSHFFFSVNVCVPDVFESPKNEFLHSVCLILLKFKGEGAKMFTCKK